MLGVLARVGLRKDAKPQRPQRVVTRAQEVSFVLSPSRLLAYLRLVKKLITATNRADPIIDHMIGKCSPPKVIVNRWGK